MQNTYKQLNDRGKIKWRLGILIFICLLFFSMLISIRVGAKDISFSTIVNSFLHYDKINSYSSATQLQSGYTLKFA